MPSTEFLLYLVIVIFAVFLIMNYYNSYSPSNDDREPNIQYKYIPVYKGSEEDSRSSGQYGSQYQYPGGQNVNVDVRQEQSGYPGMMGGPGMPPGPGLGPGPVGGPGVPPPGIPIDPLRKFDYDSVNDDFTPPFRRSYYDDYNYRLVPGLFPTYTRGPPGRFRKVGTLVAEGVAANDRYKFLLLMGRQKWPGGDDYEYYAMSPNVDQKLKFYIRSRGREICGGDIVKIDELEGYTYRFSEDADLSPRYDPYII